ncbi:integrase arm-type DNA-binding domain-containing protein [Polaromonas sp. JS666]|uniref:tyrosine-type recombinase/integrase n=1 Tax=Polaromonas sp. (strain JS666 / ATCC BAA-500) TaxID=296591 RepID=UPI000885DF10|nr:integrase arm-type DNA-binding domain-containing protein [Polaromonas sp. JS666]SDN51006.1 Integrase [Polaromonas sp. JS666]
MPLTDTSCKNAKCPEGKARERFTDSGGLYLEVVPTGGKHWRWKYRFGGKEKRLALGSYPEVTLALARRARDDARLLLKAGNDPVQSKKDAKLADSVRIGNTFEAVARAWFDHWKGPKSPRHAEYVLRRLEADVFPDLGARPIAGITAPNLLAVAKKIESRGALDIAKRSLQTCGQIFRYAVAHGIIERNPGADVKPSDALKPRTKTNYARLDARDLPQLLRKIHVYSGGPYTRLAMQLMVLTFVRTGELIAARWDEFDLEAAEWRIPAERMKMRTPHIVPLSKQALVILGDLQELRGLSGLVFPGERDHERPMSNNTILGALYRMGYKGRMTGHGFRGIASTVLHELGYRHDVIELQLAHQERDEVSAAYNHATYLKERRKLMQAWADHLDKLREGAKVVSLQAA